MSLAVDRGVSRAQPAQHSRLYWAFADAFVLAWRNIVQIPRIPEQLVFSTIQPIMFVLLFRYVFGGAIQTGGDYVNFLMAGIFVQTVAFGSVNTGIGLAEDMQKGLVDRFRSLPMSRSAVLAGRTIADLVRNLFVVLVMTIVGLFVGFRPTGNPLGWLLAAGLLLLVSFSFSWIAATIGLSLRSVEAAQSAGFIWIFPLTFASSAFVPTDKMPSWLRAFADRQPITLAVNTVRDLVLGKPVGSEGWQAVVWFVAALVIFIPLAIRQYNARTAR